MSDYVLEMKGITKIFPGVKALDNVNFQLRSGEIHALMGENGAGKSTFIKIITGVHQPEEGEIYLNGKKVEFKSPKDAQRLGIAAIYQHITCYPDLSVTENIFIGHEEVDKITNRLRWKEMHLIAKKLLDELGANFGPKTQMGALSVAQQQIVEIAKALSTNAKIIIMDEPTAALTKRESEELYRIADKLKDNGTSIIFISHRLEDMYRLADRVTVFRDAKYIGTWNVSEISKEQLIFSMVGRELTQMFPEREPKISSEILKVEKLRRIGFFEDISFSVNKGEVVALTGLVGAGRSEVCQSIFGLDKYDGGKIFVDGKEANIKSPSDAMSYGIGYLPEDRQKQGLVLDWEIVKNITLSTLDKYSKQNWINVKHECERAQFLSEKVSVKTKSIFNHASSLSGGNQQKVIVAKLLSADLKLIILDEPTKGIDVGAKYAIYEIMNELVALGYGILMISSELPEVLGMSDRIIVMCEGRITATFSKDEATQEKILEAAMAKQTATIA
jgi:rhamnose transport system ATP-binding protein